MDKAEVIKISVAYIGDDISYWKNLENGISSYFSQDFLGLGEDRKKIELSFQRIFHESDPYHHKDFLTLRTSLPDILYFDLSEPTDSSLYLLQLLKGCESTKKITTMCLFREETSFTNVIKALHKKADLTHFKSTDDWFSIYNIFKLRYPQTILNKQYAEVKYTESTYLQNELRIQSLSNNRVLVESQIQIPQAKTISLDWEMDSKIIPQKIFQLIEYSSENSYFDNPYLYKLEPLFIQGKDKKQSVFDKEKLKLEAAYENVDSSKLKFIEEDSSISPELILYSKENNQICEQYIKDAEKTDQQLIELFRGKLNNWIIKHNKKGPASLPNKVLAIDPKMKLLAQSVPFDQDSCTLKIQDFIKDFSFEITNFKPHIVALELDSTSNEDHLKEINFSTLKKIISNLTKISDYFPIIILFNCPTGQSQKLQHGLEYHQLIAHKGHINIKIIQLLLKSLSAKQENIRQARAITKAKEYAKSELKSITDVKVEDFLEQKAHFSGTEPSSSLWSTIPIEMIEMTESEITFYSEHIIEEGTLLRFKIPILFFITTIHFPVKNRFATKIKYKAIIHSITYKRSQLLRQYINKIMELRNTNGGLVPKEKMDYLKQTLKNKDK